MRALAAIGLVLVLAAPAAGSETRRDGWLSLFDGRSTAGWVMTGPGRFTVERGALVSQGGMGLLWYERRRFRDFELQVDWKVAHRCDNSGVFVRFPGRPRSPLDAVRSGYEVQIDDCDRRGPVYRTGAVYGESPAAPIAARAAGRWNRFLIRAVGQRYTVWLNGSRVTTHTGRRGLIGYLGLQNHDSGSRVSFRRILARPLAQGG